MSQTATPKVQASVATQLSVPASIGVPILFAITLFVSALLLFLVQPMIAKMILPYLGGSPAVWNTCQVFFQAVLLIGYTYSHVSTGWMGVRKQGWLHMGIMLVPLAVLPLSLRNWEPPNGDPIGWLWWIFLLLSVSVGLPFFILSTTAPLMQRWFTETGHPSARDPYFLYAASNFGSMLALLGFPSVVEPNIPVKGDGTTWVTQVNLWAIGYVILLVLLAACRLVVAMSKPVHADEAEGSDRKEKVAAPEADATPGPSIWTRVRWIALAFVPSSLMLGVTTYLTLDIAAIPLLWVIPLSIYLLTFILVFARWPASMHNIFVALMPLVILLVVFMQESGVRPEVKTTIILYLSTLFVVAMMCHGELARTKPQPNRLTEFYLLMSLGGVLGGLFNGLAAPLMFNEVIEHEIAMVLACFLVPVLSPNTGLFLERILSLKPRVERGVIVDVTAAVLLGCTAYGLLYFNSYFNTTYNAQFTHPYGFRVWNLVHKGALKASEGVSKSVTWVSDAGGSTRSWVSRNIFRRQAEQAESTGNKHQVTSSFFISPHRIMMIFLYGTPILICYAFAMRPLRFGLAVSCFVVASILFDHGLVVRGEVLAEGHEEEPLYQDRSFFGVLKVVEDKVDEPEEFQAHALYHGTTLHGKQYMLPEFQDLPITYYYRTGPVGQAFAAARKLGKKKKNLAVIGLGSGTTACYGEKGDTLTYYEIDNAVVKIAKNPEYFTFLSNCEKRGCPIDIIMGDARLQMKKAADHSYDMIVVDAFSSDAIPVHLLTKQAVEMYFDKLAPHGYLFIHISNRYLKLAPVVFKIAEALGVHGMEQYDDNVIGFAGKTSSDWIVLAKDEADLTPLTFNQVTLDQWSKSPPFVGVWPVLGFMIPSQPALDFIDKQKSMWRKLELDKQYENLRVWTDDYSNLLRVFEW